ncbi:MAG: DUF4252 domain-containing protein [Saprospiraceae bacterium]|nr:DUF4252 domain-containing protein [Saprospiraceae bacterium]
MKNLIALIGFLLISAVGISQSNIIDKYFADQQSDPATTKLNVAKKSFELFQTIETKKEVEQQIISSLQKLDGIKGLFRENKDGGLEIYRTADGQIKFDDAYAELMSFQHEDNLGQFLIREEGELILELAVMFASGNDLGVVTIFGEIDLKSITSLAKAIENNGKAWFEVFENIAAEEIVFSGNAQNRENNNSGILSEELNLRVYPNPARDFINLQPEKGSTGLYELGFYSLLGEPIQASTKVSLPHQLLLKDVPSGSYFLRITDEAGQFKNFKIVIE